MKTRNQQHIRHGLATATTALLMAAMSTAVAQPADPDEDGGRATMTDQLVDSRKGFVARIPKEARLDSAASGWSRKGRYEIRVYRLPGVGVIRFITTVKTQVIPRDTVNNGSYIYAEHDSATERGNAAIRTYYMPTRSVRIELIPISLRMMRYIEARNEIFDTFRWKPGANTDLIDTP